MIHLHSFRDDVLYQSSRNTGRSHSLCNHPLLTISEITDFHELRYTWVQGSRGAGRERNDTDMFLATILWVCGKKGPPCYQASKELGEGILSPSPREGGEAHLGEGGTLNWQVGWWNVVGVGGLLPLDSLRPRLGSCLRETGMAVLTVWPRIPSKEKIPPGVFLNQYITQINLMDIIEKKLELQLMNQLLRVLLLLGCLAGWIKNTRLFFEALALCLCFLCHCWNSRPSAPPRGSLRSSVLSLFFSSYWPFQFPSWCCRPCLSSLPCLGFWQVQV